MMDLRQDSTIVHSCSGKCVYRNDQGFLALRERPCDKFTKVDNPSGTIVLSHRSSGLCVSVDVTNRLNLANCNTQYLFEVTKSGNKLLYTVHVHGKRICKRLSGLMTAPMYWL